jgi:hypothetical protein
MSVYVDRLFDWGWRLGPSCHLIADTEAELHALAGRIGLLRRWYQGRASTPHYDLTASRRVLAIQAGAIELDRDPYIDKVRELRQKRLATP